MRRKLESGSAGALIFLLLVIVMVTLAASSVVSRIAASSSDTTRTLENLEKAVQALEAYAAAAQRLPCPADPEVDTGAEVPTAVGAATCSFPEGTLPWLTIGLKREDALDSWGRKLSYRVYTGNQGSLTQPGGVSMVNCDTVEPAPVGTTATGGGAGGLCEPGATIQARDTEASQFLAGKGVNLTDMGANHGDVAYVVLSHGATGLGAYTVSGARLDMPSGDERNNTNAAGAFTIKAHSDPDTAASSGQHFDDFLAYRRLGELVRRIGLGARDWPET